MQHDPKANWQRCLNTVADLTLIALHEIVTHLSFVLEGLNHKSGETKQLLIYNFKFHARNF